MIEHILQELAATSSRLEKEAILSKNKDNDLLKRVIIAAINPYINYYIKQIPDFNGTGDMSLECALDELTKLSSRAVTGHAAIAHLKHVIESVSVDDQDVIIKIIRHDLRCCVSIATVNKIWDGLIAE